jgi:hypothetical protein
MPKKDKQKRSVIQKRYRERHKQELAVYAKAYRESHRAEKLAYAKAYHESHRPERLAYGKAYREANKQLLNARNRDYWNSHVEEMAASRRLKRYGLTKNQFDRQIKKQNNCCAACGDKFRDQKSICVDHCHVGGHFRGILCKACNTAEGALRTPERAFKLAKYMESGGLFYVVKERDAAA